MADISSTEESEEFETTETSSDSCSAETSSVESESDGETTNQKSANTKPNTSRKGQCKRRKADSSCVSKEEFNDLTAWISSPQNSDDVVSVIRVKLLESPRIKAFADREIIANHFTSEPQTDNFKKLIRGFCTRFSTLCEGHYHTEEKYRKAVFSVAWMKILSNFNIGKSTQERSVLQLLLKDEFNSEAVHSVVSVIHEMVYATVHNLVQNKKQIPTPGQSVPQSNLAPESDDTLYRFCGAALHRMVTVKTETLNEKTGRGRLTRKRRTLMEQELKLLECLIMKDKSKIPQTLRNLDEGNLKFPKADLLDFLRAVDNEVRGFVNDENLKRYSTSLIKLCKQAVTNNQVLQEKFKDTVNSLALDGKFDHVDQDVVRSVCKELVSKVSNTRVNEYWKAKVERDLRKNEKVVDADEMLRDKLKSYAVATNRK